MFKSGLYGIFDLLRVESPTRKEVSSKYVRCIYNHRIFFPQVVSALICISYLVELFVVGSDSLFDIHKASHKDSTNKTTTNQKKSRPEIPTKTRLSSYRTIFTNMRKNYPNTISGGDISNTSRGRVGRHGSISSMTRMEKVCILQP